ncbi:MAG: protease modulator HflC, partial [Candidatus Methylopumilus sp.]|nr:protease modulator HflC [Candidatus Methylopumilus sp.]
MKNIGLIIITLLLLVLLASSATFTVDQREYALVKRLGEVVAIKKSPGLYVKMPFVDNVVYFDKRILTLDW